MTRLPASLFDLIDTDSFRQRPGMYLGQKSIALLNALINGYIYAVDSYQISDDKEIKFRTFRDWVVKFYHAGQYNGGWEHLILEKCNGDSEKAVDTFFDLYDRFNRGE